MKVDGVSYSYSMGTMTIYVHNGDKCKSIADMDITDRDFDRKEDADYMQNLAVEIAEELGYIL